MQNVGEQFGCPNEVVVVKRQTENVWKTHIHWPEVCQGGRGGQQDICHRDRWVRIVTIGRADEQIVLWPGGHERAVE